MIDYDPHSWRSHLLDIRGSMAREIILRVTLFTLWSACVVILHEQFGWKFQSSIHALVGTALSLLLVLRTNSAYDRFWEGRKLWGGIVNETRNLARMAVTHLEDAPELRDRIVRWTIAFAYASMFSLRQKVRAEGDAPPPEELPLRQHALQALGPAAVGISDAQCETVLQANHLPLAVARQISAALREARDRELISDFVMLNADQNTQLLIDYVGGCERIHKTPIPFAYMVHVRRALIAYCLSLPFALVDEFHWLTVAITFVVSYVFIGIEEIGVEIEDPFGDDDNDLPLEGICSTIERNLLDVIHQPPPKPEFISE